MNSETNSNLNITVNNQATASNGRKKLGIKIVAVMLIFSFLLIIFGLGIYGFISEDRSFSESENRVLAKAPSISVDSILSGRFMKDFEVYISDQFPLRDEAINLKTFLDRIVGKKEENGVYIGSDNFLFDSQTEFDKNKVNKTTKALNSFCQKFESTKKLIAISPNSSYIYKELLPDYLELPDQSKQIKRIYNSFDCETLKKVNVTGLLNREKKKGNELFYKTDHHWTTGAAYSVFSFIAKYWKLGADEIPYYFYPVTNEFNGTLSGKTGIYDVSDTIEICIPDGSYASYVVNYEQQQKKTATLFEKDKLDNKNKYEVFLGGNYGKVVISTISKSRNSLLIIKDSFANCMIPMFTPYFSQIVVIDPRYLSADIYSEISEYEFTHMLILYNLNTFLEDSAIVSVMSE